MSLLKNKLKSDLWFKGKNSLRLGVSYMELGCILECVKGETVGTRVRA